ncbi:hypothetical protein MBOT_39490 [Mycobacterium botniense]|uniref:Uncharacterized protein n=1 Tax=Mycobacterium botniense TaxID=84962 RepID=A0A7I9Y3J1_9MYCO|nr:hypothetical protein MBOT_39490 [Mycobacterium botniense]
MLGDLAGSHRSGLAFDADEGYTVGAGDSTKAHPPEPNDNRPRSGAGHQLNPRLPVPASIVITKIASSVPCRMLRGIP